MRSHLVSILIGLLVTCGMTFFSYCFIERQNSNDYLKSDSRFYENLELIQSRIDDLKMTSRSFKEVKAPLALIAIDDASIEEIGRWPWSRTIISEITSEIIQNGAQTVTYDIVMSEPERENPQADFILGQTVEKYADQVVLGTSSSSQYPAQTHPYQDICTAEAFLYLGGDKIVPLNTTFVVDDQGENFDSYKWTQLFENIFQALSADVERQFLVNLNLLNTDQMTLYQKNSLKAQKNKSIYQYCRAWLTDDDPFLKDTLFEKIKPSYEEAFGQKLDQNTINQLFTQIKKAKAQAIPQYLGWYSNTPLIQDKSKFTAAFNTKLDSDGLIRRYPLFYRAGSKIGSSYIPSLALQTYLIAMNYRAEVTITENKNEKMINTFKIFNSENDKTPLFQVPVDTFSQLRLNFYGPEKSFYYVSAKELLTKNQNQIEVQWRTNNELKKEMVDKKEFFKGRSVLLGATALGIYDVRNTPVQNALPGPEIQLTAMANLFERNFILNVVDASYWVPTITFILGLVFTITWAWANAVISIIIFIFSFSTLIFVDYFLYVKKNYMITNWSFFAVLLFPFIAISLYKYFSEERNKNKVRKAFSKYVSPEVVEELLKSEKNLKLGGEKKNLTVLFSDLRGFTSFSEKLEPQQLSDFLNIYLTRMTEEIYKTKGTVDKFIGDAIMAFYGAPVSNEKHAQLACKCALESVKRLDLLNLELKGKNFPHLEVGFGINTGDMSVGNMGSATIQNYTVMGDSVNLASRLEGLTRLYGNFIVLGPDTYAAVKNEFTCREIDQVVVKGKSNAILIYDLVYEGPLKSADTEWMSHYIVGRHKYLEGDFSEALKAFQKSSELKLEDKISLYYVRKCEEFIENPPDKWTGVNYLREK